MHESQSRAMRKTTTVLVYTKGRGSRTRAFTFGGSHFSRLETAQTVTHQSKKKQCCTENWKHYLFTVFLSSGRRFLLLYYEMVVEGGPFSTHSSLPPPIPPGRPLFVPKSRISSVQRRTHVAPAVSVPHGNSSFILKWGRRNQKTTHFPFLIQRKPNILEIEFNLVFGVKYING